MNKNFLREKKYVGIGLIVVVAVVVAGAGLFAAGVFAPREVSHEVYRDTQNKEEQNNTSSQIGDEPVASVQSDTGEAVSPTSNTSPNPTSAGAHATGSIYPGSTQGGQPNNNQGVSPAVPVTSQGTPTIAPNPQSSSQAPASSNTVVVQPSSGLTPSQPWQQRYPSATGQGAVPPRPVYEMVYFEHRTLPTNFYCQSNPCSFSFNSIGEYRVDGSVNATLSAEKLNALRLVIDQTNYGVIQARNAPQTSLLNPAYGCSQQSGKVVYTFQLTNGQTEIIDACQHTISPGEEPFKTIEYLQSMYP